jgi:hypothetical protein
MEITFIVDSNAGKLARWLQEVYHSRVHEGIGESPQERFARALEGYFEGDAQRMAKAIHPELTKLRPLVLPQTGKTAFDKMGASMLVGIAGSKSGLMEKEKRGIGVKIYDFNKDMASVEVICSLFYDYLQMAKIDGEWKIINVLWRMNPAAETNKR